MKTLFSLILVVLLFSCEDKVSYKKPEGLISKDKMIEMLYEMHLVVGTSNIKNVHLEKNRNYMSLVYEKYGIDSTQFAVSNVYYTAHIQEYEEIFEEVERRIQDLKDELEPKADTTAGVPKRDREPRQKKDSVKGIPQ